MAEFVRFKSSNKFNFTNPPFPLGYSSVRFVPPFSHISNGRTCPFSRKIQSFSRKIHSSDRNPGLDRPTFLSPPRAFLRGGDQFMQNRRR
ncbi:hypothetical protein LOK49_LG04G02293 [Camellia lanceoleosa]|uniref:Uncharacterized protein n=1 Tax=Camellia lanceoleosa TaxID=1840588 RepID=A0ACC0HVZ0_9ERIC|nr:hypothetical protein LOK49_LG04G02293 [Camellia lanceoleosa]